MDRAFSSGSSASPPAAPASPSIGYPTSGNSGTGTPATKPGPYWYYMMTEEIRGVLVAAGLTPSQADVTQLLQALRAAGVFTTQAVTDSSTKAATTAFVQAAIAAGHVMFYAASAAPAGYLKANGAAISRTTYAALFAAIGTTFGVGDGSTTFNVPDLRGEFLRGFDDARGVDSGRVFGSAQAQDFLSHVHNFSNGLVVYNTAGGGTFYSGGVNGASGINQNTAAAGGTETRPRNVALLACIKY